MGVGIGSVRAYEPGEQNSSPGPATFFKSLLFRGLSFLIWKMRGLGDCVLAFAISLT